MKPLPLSYFDEYADDDVEDRSYKSNWRDYGFNRLEDYFLELKSRYRPTPTTLLEIGSADGSVLRELRSRGIKVRGVEFNTDMYKQAGFDKSLISNADAYQVLKAIQNDSYQCVYETAAQYIPEKLLRNYFREINRVVTTDLVVVLHTIDEDPKPHKHQVNHKSAKFWFDLIEECGFTRGNDANIPFWFTKDK